MIYRLFEYRFATPEDYSSIELVQAKNYSLQDTKISRQNLLEVRRNTAVKTDDNMEGTKIPLFRPIPWIG